MCVNDINLQNREINERILKYNTNFGMMYPLLKDRHVPRQSKIIIYKKKLKPKLLFGAEKTSLTTKTQFKLQFKAQMRVLRLIKGVKRRDKCRNSYFREEMDVRSILEDIECSKLRWYGHVMRMGNDRLPIQVPEMGTRRKQTNKGTEERMDRWVKNRNE